MGQTRKPDTTLMPALPSYARTALAHWHDGRGKIFTAIAAGWFLSIGIRMVYPVLLPFLRVDYGLSLTMAGFLLTVLWLAYSVGQIPGGILADWIGEGITMAVSMAIGAATIVLIVTADSPAVLFAGTGLLGLSIALFGTVRLTATADVYPDQVGTVHGFLGAVGDIGNTILPPAAGIIAAVTVWQLGFGILIPFFLLVAAALWWYVPTRTSPAAATRSVFSLETARRVAAELRRPSLVFGTIIMIFTLSISQAFTGFFPTYLIEVKGMSEVLASSLFAFFFALGVLIRPAAGNAYDRVGLRRTLFAITTVTALGFVILPFVDSTLMLVGVTVLIAAKAGQGTIVMAYMTVALSPDVQNTGLGISRTVFFAASALSPFVFGAIADQGYFDEAFLLLAALSGVVLVLILRLPALPD